MRRYGETWEKVLLIAVLAVHARAQAAGHEARDQEDEISSLLQTVVAVSARGVEAASSFDGRFTAHEQHGVVSTRVVVNATAAASRSELVSKARSGQPINSSGKDRASSLDIALLVLCLLVPFAIYLVLARLEHWRKAAEEEEERGKEADLRRAKVDHHREHHRHSRRMGSNYHLEPQPQNVSLIPLQAASPSNNIALRTDSGNIVIDKEGTVLENVLAGFSTAMAALPDAISFSFITGMSPLNGIWAGVFMGLSAALVGGRPGMISSASAATAVVLADISTNIEFGMGFMALTVFVVGIVQLLMAVFRLSRFITMVPHPVMLGFVNGLAIVMIKAQLRQYRENGDGAWVEKADIIGMTVTALFAMLAALAWSRIPRASKVLPAPLASVILTAVFAIVFQKTCGLKRRTLEHVAGSATFAGGTSTLPPWNFPPAGVQWDDPSKLLKVLSIAVRFAIVGILESLMTQSLIDQITGTQGSARQECFGQGVGNILSSFFGLQGGCALIAQSLMNVGSGGRSRLSGIVMALTLAACVVVLAPVMSQIPVAALVGLITLIALNTFAWGSLELLLRIDVVDAIVVVLVTVVTVWKDLAVAVLAGIIVSGLGFAWTAATEVTVNNRVDGTGHRRFSVRGPLFFGSAMNYRTAVCSEPFSENQVLLDFDRARVLDVSGLEAVVKTVEHLQDAGKQVFVQGLHQDIVDNLPPDVQTCERADSMSPASAHS